MATKRQIDVLSCKICKWLYPRRKTDGQGGWAEIEPKDINGLYRITHELIKLKSSPDADGVFPIEVHITNRRLGYHVGADIPYPSSDETKRLLILGGLCASAIEQFHTALRIMEEHRRETD